LSRQFCKSIIRGFREYKLNAYRLHCFPLIYVIAGDIIDPQNFSIFSAFLGEIDRLIDTSYNIFNCEPVVPITILSLLGDSQRCHSAQLHVLQFQICFLTLEITRP